MSDEENEKPDECYFCGYPTTELEFYHYKGASVKDAWLCLVCASTTAGNAYHFPSHYENKEIMKQISFCSNLILDKLNRATPTVVNGIDELKNTLEDK